MRAVRKDYFLDHDHSAYVDQWDWERVITAEQRNLGLPEGDGADDLEGPARRRGARPGAVPAARTTTGTRTCPRRSTFIHAEDLLDAYPDLPRKQRETEILQEHPAVFIIGIGWTLEDGYPHEMRAADYDDWVTETGRRRRAADARPQRRHPGLEPGHAAPPRADVDGHPRQRRRPCASSSRSPASSTG